MYGTTGYAYASQDYSEQQRQDEAERELAQVEELATAIRQERDAVEGTPWSADVKRGVALGAAVTRLYDRVRVANAVHTPDGLVLVVVGDPTDEYDDLADLLNDGSGIVLNALGLPDASAITVRVI